MPLYRCSYPEGALDPSQRQALAIAFTDIHCELTGAPRTFVHVQFHARPASADGPQYELHAGIRAGRDRALADALVSRCVAALSAATGAPPSAITMRTSGTPASWILEGGRVLPEPGEEEDWLAGTGDQA